MNETFTVRIPFQSYTDDRITPFHPTESSGPFSTLVRGCFVTRAEAFIWARRTLDVRGATIWEIVPIQPITD